uniref:CAZy families GH32 protein n=1 Tax=uncultured Tolumonas sp. TaxID=263765 RepID=A0A060CPC4_9GAMM|nr:CAZy families GH32 protein [uncultured Tolumonas sp.]
MLVVGIGAADQHGALLPSILWGIFDGSTFTNANTPETVLWFDWGADFYAAQSWDSAPMDAASSRHG